MLSEDTNRNMEVNPSSLDKVNFDPLDIQSSDLPSIENKKSSIKQGLAYVVLVLIIIPAIITNIYFFKKIQKVTVGESNKPFQFASTRLSEGEEVVNIKPGGVFILADGISSVHFKKEVPEVIFDKNYSLDDIHAINYLGIQKELSFYSEGYFYKLTNLRCNKAQKVDSDMVFTAVTDCDLRIVTKKEVAPTKQLTSFSKLLHTTQLFVGQVSPSNELLVYVLMPELSVLNYSTQFSSKNASLRVDSTTGYSESRFWDVLFVTGYGIETIRYTAEELWNKESKEVSVGPLHIKSKIQDFSCVITYRGPSGEKTQRCDDVSVELSFAQTEQQIPIKILTYSN